MGDTCEQAFTPTTQLHTRHVLQVKFFPGESKSMSFQEQREIFPEFPHAEPYVAFSNKHGNWFRFFFFSFTIDFLTLRTLIPLCTR
jgi:hypothetical protein